VVTILVKSALPHPPIPQYLLAKWQRIVNLLTRIAGVSSGMISRLDPPQTEALIVSENPDNPYQAGERHNLGAGRYCEAVITLRSPLLIANARQDSAWDHNPDIQRQMISYLGLPLQWPDDDIFGTLCVLDRKENHYADKYRDLLAEFKQVIEEDLRQLSANSVKNLVPANALKENKERTQMAVQESEATARALLNTPSILTILLDSNGFILDANDAMSARFDKSRDTLIGLCLWDLLPADILELRKRRIMVTFNTGKIQRWEDYRAGAWFESCANPVFDEHGKVNKIAVVAYDITERKLVQEALEKSERKYRELVDEAATIILRWDINGNVTFFNEYAQSFFGFTENEIIGKNVVGTIVPETEFTGRDLALLMAEICRDPTKFEDNENENIKRNGDQVWIAWKNRPIYNDAGDLFEIHSVGIDITARKRAEEALRRSEALWRSIADNSPDHIVTLDPNLNIEYVNFSSPGLTKEELIGTPLYKYVSVEKQGEIKAILENVLKTGEPCTYESQYEIPGGGTIYYESIAAPRILSDTVIGLTVNARDISTHKRAEQVLRRSEVFELLATGASLNEILAALTAGAEKRDPQLLCAILLLDKNRNRLRYAATSTNFPDAFIELINSKEIGPAACSSGSAAFTGERVIAEDVMVHPYWLNHRDLAQNIGLGSCWSEPIKSTSEEVLGTFAIYHHTPYKPRQSDLDFIQDSARLAGIAIEQKQAEAALRESEQRYRGLVELSPDGVVVHDYEGTILFANSAATKLVGATNTAQWSGQPITKFIHPEFRKEAENLITRIIREQQPSQRVEQKFITLTDREVDVEVSGVPLSYGGKPAIQIIAHDISARKRAEEKIRTSEKELTAILDSMQDVYYRTDVNGHVLKVSPSVQDVFGYQPLEVIGEKISYFWVNPEDREKLLEALRAQGGAVHDFETRVKRKDGSISWASANSHFYLDETGNIGGVEGTIRDTTERKHTEHELQQSRRHFQSLDRISHALSKAPELNSMLWDVLKETLEIFNVDRTWLLYPCDPDTPTWKVPVEVTRPEYPGAFSQGEQIPTDPYVAEIFREATTTTDPVTLSFTHDGTEPDWARQFNIHSQMTVAVSPKIDKPWLLGMHQCSHKRDWTDEEKRLFRDVAERVTNALTNRLLLERLEADIEDRIRTEKELERQKALFEAVFNDVPDAMLLADTERAIVMCNPALSRIFGYASAELIGKKTQILYESLKEYERQGRIRFNLGTEAELKPYVVSYKRKNGEVFPGETVGTSIKTNNGDTLGFIGVIRDITERKRAEEQARQHQAELAHIARLNTMGELATGIAHELNQPLAAIANYAAASRKMLDSGNTHPDKLARALEATQTQAKRASEIIRHLRQFVRKQSPHKTPINLNDLINSVLSFMESEIDNQSIKIRLELTEELPEVIADSIQIEQVLVNLVRNSMEAMNHVEPDGRQLFVGTYLNKEQDAAQVEVADTGVGIDTETLNTIFEPFVTTKGDKGMGLGLSISRSIIEAHNGRLWVESQLGSGSRFYFTLPTVVER
jgi:PAS domain S-box-containing protein